MLEDPIGVWPDKTVGFLWHHRRRGSASESEPDGLEWLHERRGVFLKSKKEPPSDFFFVTAPMTNMGVPVRTSEGD